ncbi:MAG: hypothetical protein ACYDAY_10230 [Candidatus Dormibacteria bacterium]
MALLERRGYALGPAAVARLCVGGPLSEAEVVRWVSTLPGVAIRDGLVLPAGLRRRQRELEQRRAGHAAQRALMLPVTRRFVAMLVAVCPFIDSVAVAGSLASGGFAATDDVDLNLVVQDGTRHLAYVVLNLLAIVHAMKFRGRPTDSHTRRPVAPRLMTANLILERRQCLPLARSDEDMAFELLQSEPIFGAAALERIIRDNRELVSHFPQLLGRRAPDPVVAGWRLPRWLFPHWLDGPCRRLGGTAWHWMMWTRRHDPEALSRVALVRRTMRPYALFDESC